MVTEATSNPPQQDVAAQRRAGMGLFAGQESAPPDGAFDAMTDAEIVETFGDAFEAIASTPPGDET